MAHPQVDGLLENWIWKIVGALKSRQSQPVNVGLVDWISLAYQHYAVAVRNTRVVGQDVAALLLWLEVSPPTCPYFSKGPQCPDCKSEARYEASPLPFFALLLSRQSCLHTLPVSGNNGVQLLPRVSHGSMVCWLVYWQLDTS